MNAWASFLVTAGWSHFLQLAVLAGVLALVDLALGRRLGAYWRCALWLLFFVKLALPPQLALPTSPVYWWSANDRAAVTTVAPATPASAPGTVWSSSTDQSAPAVPAAAENPTTPWPSWPTFVVAGWLAGVVTLGTATLVRHRRLAHRLRHGARASAALEASMDRARAQIGLRPRVALRLTETDLGPMVSGLWRPTIHLPRALVERLTVDQLHAVLVHELYHVKRGDLWVAAVQTIARVVCFHHPAVWWVNAHLARLREEATDQAVLSHAAIDRRSYSFALVEAAALVARAVPFSHFALGVIETKTQLQKRITMNLSLPRSGRVHLGLPGLLSLVLLALVLVPMMPAQPGADPKTPPAGFKSVDAVPLQQRVDAATAAILSAFNHRDRDAYLATFAETAYLLPDGAGFTTGRNGVAQMYLRAPAGLVYEPMVWSDRRFFQIDRWIIETGLVGFRFRLTPDAPILNDQRQAFTIWEEGDDGTLRVKLLSWNKFVEPGVLQRQAKPGAFVRERVSGPFAVSGDFAPVLAAEESFHQAIAARRVEPAAGFYAAGATLIAPGHLPVHGQAAILRFLEGLAPEEFATSTERQVAHVEGNANHVLVVNLFRWTFEPPGTSVPIPIAGKGVHFWQRGDDGAWRILFDLPNVSQPSEGS